MRTTQLGAGPDATGPGGVVAGQCKLAALGAPTEGGAFYASGSTKFVAASEAGYAIGSAVGSAVKKNAIYNACMEANGFVAADELPPQQTAVAAPQLSEPGEPIQLLPAKNVSGDIVGP
jgi:hypothetical protein